MNLIHIALVIGSIIGFPFMYLENHIIVFVISSFILFLIFFSLIFIISTKKYDYWLEPKSVIRV